MNGQGLGALALLDWFLRARLEPGLAGSHRPGGEPSPDAQKEAHGVTQKDRAVS